MTEAQKTVWDALQAHCFNGPTCHPSQELLAHQCGYTREYVNRIIRQLREAGHLTVSKVRRGRWDHNVYRLTSWVPPLRSKTLASIARARAQISAASRAVHTKRTAKSFWGSPDSSSLADNGAANASGRARGDKHAQRRFDGPAEPQEPKSWADWWARTLAGTQAVGCAGP